MGGFSRIYLNSAGQTLPDFAQMVLKDLRAKRNKDSSIYYRADNPWLLISPGMLFPYHEICVKLTKKYDTDAIRLDVQTAAFACSYVHYVHGNVARELHKADFCWKRVVGTPEAWEDKILFEGQAKTLKRLNAPIPQSELALFKRLFPNETDAQREASRKAEIDAVINRRIVAGNSWPDFDADHVVNAFDLPGISPEFDEPGTARSMWIYTEQA